ncbi:hypothetical protein [Dictyobacter kobayashii]|uniref:Uncharacterized protein n=1 Tax=Dictyobacter kobayashii TaxID=2014872 RepID=A0A402AF33_9CHLR|nr:hypothetical protein [Dictyobacter kobayashii]GCE17672.1 hypothetical protein KDK_14720 [Dictyobacter kobayashii]
MKFTKNDFLPLSKFEYLYRWNDSNISTLSQETLSQIHYLNARKAKEVDDKLSIINKKFYTYIFASLRSEESYGEFSDIRLFSVKENGLQSIPIWFFSLEIPPATEMIFSWEMHIAVKTTWEIFTRYWDDFFYFGQDDLSIGAINGPWYLLLFHEGYFVYGHIKENLL